MNIQAPQKDEALPHKPPLAFSHKTENNNVSHPQLHIPSIPPHPDAISLGQQNVERPTSPLSPLPVTKSSNYFKDKGETQDLFDGFCVFEHVCLSTMKLFTKCAGKTQGLLPHGK